ncbi:MAG TPA: hypothetical protein VLH35_01415 [Candidatus Acidoferrales bacterium]|nr:hypothetical protein [Candidatus Acidoferrales bacterium]
MIVLIGLQTFSAPKMQRLTISTTKQQRTPNANTKTAAAAKPLKK